MSHNLSPVVLGIDPGARQIGISITRGGELVFYAVKTIKRADNNETLEHAKAIVGKFVEDYRVRFVAVEKIGYVQQRASFAGVVCGEITGFLRSQSIEFFEYSPKEIRTLICRSEKPTKRNTWLMLAQAYPELTRYFDVSKPWQKRYYALMFGAIAAGLMCAQELEQTAASQSGEK